MEEKYDIKKILEALPHRYPFVMIDRVMEIVRGEKIIAYKNVTINEPFFQGHFPGVPIMPGVLIMEAMAQAGCILGFESSFQKKGGILFFAGMDNVRFRQPVVPGDQLMIEVTFLRQKAKVVKLKGVATVAGKVVAEAELMAYKGENV